MIFMNPSHQTSGFHTLPIAIVANSNTNLHQQPPAITNQHSSPVSLPTFHSSFTCTLLSILHSLFTIFNHSSTSYGLGGLGDWRMNVLSSSKRGEMKSQYFEEIVLRITIIKMGRLISLKF